MLSAPVLLLSIDHDDFDHSLERDQEKWSPVFRPIPLYTFENDHVHQLELIQLKLIVI